MRKKILVPLDGSKMGESALSAVDNFLVADSKDEVEIVLISVITSLSHWVKDGEAGVDAAPSGPIPYTEKELDIIRNSTRTYLDSVAKRLERSGLKVTTEVRTGHADREILKAIGELNINIVAMSTHGRTGFSRWILGNVAEKVLRHGTSHLLLVHAAAI